MGATGNEAVSRRFIEEVFNQGSDDVMDGQRHQDGQMVGMPASGNGAR
jgi:hypothetical protein